jgi:hypothetical protein
MYWKPNIGDLIWVPKNPLGIYAKVGNMDFWKIGIITSIDEYSSVWFYYNDHFEKIHVKHIRRMEPETGK